MRKFLICIIAALALSAGVAASAQATGNLWGVVLWNGSTVCSTCNGIVVQLAGAGTCTVGYTYTPATGNTGRWDVFYVPTPCNFRVYGRSKTAVDSCYWYTDYQDFYYNGSPSTLYTGARILNHRACMNSLVPAVLIQ